VSWRAGLICMECQRRIHGPGTGVVGPEPEWPPLLELGWERPICWLCFSTASPANYMRLWIDGGDPLDHDADDLYRWY